MNLSDKDKTNLLENFNLSDQISSIDYHGCSKDSIQIRISNQLARLIELEELRRD